MKISISILLLILILLFSQLPGYTKSGSTDLELRKHIENPKELEEVFIKEVAITKKLQPDWNSKALEIEFVRVKNGGNPVPFIELACQTPRLRLALWDAAYHYKAPITGAETSSLLRFVEKYNYTLDKYLAELEEKNLPLFEVSPGLFEKERRELAEGYQNMNKSPANLLYLEHLVLEDASKEVIERELSWQQRMIKVLKDYPERRNSFSDRKAEKCSDSKSLEVVKAMRSHLSQAIAEFRQGNIDKSDDSLILLLKSAERLGNQQILRYVLSNYRIYWQATKHRPNKNKQDKNPKNNFHEAAKHLIDSASQK